MEKGLKYICLEVSTQVSLRGMTLAVQPHSSINPIFRSSSACKTIMLLHCSMNFKLKDFLSYSDFPDKMHQEGTFNPVIIENRSPVDADKS